MLVWHIKIVKVFHNIKLCYHVNHVNQRSNNFNSVAIINTEVDLGTTTRY